MVMVSDFGQEGFDFITDAAKDPLNSVHTVYLLVKSVVPKVLWSAVSSFTRVLSLEKMSLPFRDKSKLSRWK